MNYTIKLILMWTLAFVLLAGSIFGQVPQLINYQGRLTGSTGNHLDTVVSMTFTIYDDSTTVSGQWTETQDSVIVTEGLFNVLLGSSNAIPTDLFDTPNRFLGIQIGNDTEIAPRTRLVSVAYSMNCDKLDGFDSEDFILPNEAPPSFCDYKSVSPGATVTIFESAGYIREITSIVVSTNGPSIVDIIIAGELKMKFLATESNTFTWYRNNGAGILVGTSEIVEVHCQSGSGAYVTIIGFKYF